MASEALIAITDVCLQWSEERVKNAQDILKSKGIHERMQLPQSIYTIQKLTPTALQIDFFANDYYIFVDKGVAGVFNKADTTGQYKFKSVFPSKKMALSIANWIARKPIQIRKTKEQSKQSVLDDAKKASMAIASSVKRKGIDKTLFWSGTFNERAYKDLASRIEKALGREVSFTLGE